MKDSTAPKELHRSVLKYLKIVISYLRFDDPQHSSEMTELILSHVFYLNTVKRYTMIIRRILGKLIARVGLASVTKATSKENQSLIHYIERARRKRHNAKERQRLLSLLGKDPEAKNDDPAVVAQDQSDSDFEHESGQGSEGGMDVDDGNIDDSEGSEDDSDSDSEREDNRQGVDKLQATYGIDIPIADNIPVVSLLAKEEQKDERGTRQEANKKRVSEIIE